MDPLSALREFTIRNNLDAITLTDDTFQFADLYSFPTSTQTSFRSKHGHLYSLETLIFFVRNQTLKHTDYIQSSRLRRLQSVTLPDRKPLLDYLHGLVPTSDSIVEQHLPSLHQFHPSSPPPPPHSKERPLKDRDSILQCRNRDFYSVIVASTKREDERARAELMQRKDELVAKTRLVEAGLRQGDEGVAVPIILVPSASQTLITIYNVREFLEDGVFVPTDLKAREARGGAKPDCVTVQKRLGRDRVVAAYEVRDKAAGFRAEDWERVVAVFVLGKEWQFKDWPFRDHVDIFNKIIGFYVRFEDDSVESAKIVKQWNVKIISISKNKRHQDRAAALEVWDRLEEFMRSRSHS